MTPSIITPSLPTRRTLVGLGLGIAFGLGGLVNGAIADAPPRDDAGSDQKTEATPLRALCEGNQAFALDLYRRGIEPGRNLVFSPYGISECFAMLYAGSDGETTTALQEVFRYPGTPGEILGTFAELQRRLAGRSNESCRIAIANSCWTNRGVELLPGFAREMNDDLDADLFNVDFRDRDDVKARMSKWVSSKTGGLIESVPAIEDPSTLLMLMNTVHLDAKWVAPFLANDTWNSTFHLADGSKAVVPMMNQTRDLRFLETDDLQVLEIPYQGKKASMTLVMPKAGRTLADLERTIDAGEIADWDRGMKKTLIGLKLPRFELSGTLDFNPLIEAMSSGNLLANPDLRRMLDRSQVRISKTCQDAVIKVDELGTKAAAVTRLTPDGAYGRRPEPREVIFNQPFLFMVRDCELDTIFFMGRVMDPRG